MSKSDTRAKISQNHGGASLMDCLLPLALFAVYAACAFMRFPFCDDYVYYTYVQEHWMDWTTNPIIQAGRPITSFLICWSMGLIDSIEGLWILRLTAVLFAVGYTYYLNRLLIKHGQDKYDAFALTALTMFTPAVGEYIGWAMSWPYIMAMFMATFAGSQLCEELTPNAFLKNLGRCALCSVELLLVLFTYQPISGLFLLIPFVSLTRGKMRPLAYAIAILIITYALYTFVIFPNLKFICPNWNPGARAEILNNPFEHLIVVIKELTLLASTGWNSLLLPKGGWMLVGTIPLSLSIAGLVCIASRWSGKRFFVALALAIFAIGASAPQVFLLTDLWAFRTHYPIALFLSVTAWIGISSLIQPRWRKALTITVAVLVITGAAWCVNVGLAYSGHREYRLTRDLLENVKASNISKAYVLVTPSWPFVQQPVPIYAQSCYGFISLVLMNEYQVEAIAREVWSNSQDCPEFIYVKADNVSSIPQDGAVILDLWGEISGKPTPLPAARVLP